MGNPWHREEERQRRLGQGVDGAHMCTPFQCEVCWFRNLEGKEVQPGRDDVYKEFMKLEPGETKFYDCRNYVNGNADDVIKLMKRISNRMNCNKIDPGYTIQGEGEIKLRIFHFLLTHFQKNVSNVTYWGN